MKHVKGCNCDKCKPVKHNGTCDCWNCQVKKIKRRNAKLELDKIAKEFDTKSGGIITVKDFYKIISGGK